MHTIIVDGKKIAEAIIQELQKHHASKKFLAVFVAGSDPATASFIAQKKKIAALLHIDFRIYAITAGSTNDMVREQVRAIAQKKRCGGVIIQLPLPLNLNPWYIANAIPPQKDVDLLSARTIGGFFNGSNGVLPPAVGVVKHLFETYHREVTSFHKAVIVGHGALVGRPLAAWLAGKVSTVVVIDKGGDMQHVHDADLIIAGTGQAGLILPAQCAPESWVIDFGYGTDEITGKVSGDVLWDESALSHVGLVTPTPGGTGPLLVATLFENFFMLTESTH